jgi:hypothetical protein
VSIRSVVIFIDNRIVHETNEHRVRCDSESVYPYIEHHACWDILQLDIVTEGDIGTRQLCVKVWAGGRMSIWKAN